MPGHELLCHAKYIPRTPVSPWGRHPVDRRLRGGSWGQILSSRRAILAPISLGAIDVARCGS
jgi:hypothetical protein